MMNLTRKVFSGDCSWTAPAGVTVVKVIHIPVKNLFSHASAGSTPTAYGITSACDGYAWGNPVCGLLGNGQIATAACVPTLICCGIKWKSIVASQGGNSAMGIATNGIAYGWGQNSNGQLGDNTATTRCLPSPICCGFKWKQISANSTTAGGITCSNDLYMWGAGTCGVLGNNTITSVCQPVLVCCGFKWRWFSVGRNNTAGGITVDGKIYMWGHGACGVLGNNTQTSVCQPTLICCGFTDWIFLVTSNNRAGAIRCNGDLYMWGRNACGELGICSITPQCQPTLVCCGIKWKWVSFGQGASGADPNVGVAVDGLGYAWGINTAGQLGDNTITTRCVPTLICCAFKWRMLYTSACMSGGVTMDNLFYTWGSNDCGALGIGSITYQCQPTLALSCGNPMLAQCEKIFVVTPGCSYCVQTTGRYPTFNFDLISLSEEFTSGDIVLEY